MLERDGEAGKESWLARMTRSIQAQPEAVDAPSGASARMWLSRKRAP
jgi:hypothetical protein